MKHVADAERQAAAKSAEQDAAAQQRLQAVQSECDQRRSQLQVAISDSASKTTMLTAAATTHASLSAQLSASQAVCDALRTDAAQLPALRESLVKANAESEERGSTAAANYHTADEDRRDHA
jgi:hypothetical protein